MPQFLVLFREPDGRTDQHAPEEIQQHRLDWKAWLEKMNGSGVLSGGQPLTLEGRIIKRSDSFHIENKPYTIGAEIVGGYLLLDATGLDEAATLIQSCPIFDFGGFAEIREHMQIPATQKTPPTRPLTPEQNKAIVRRFNFSFIQDGEIDTFHELIDPACINHTAPAGVPNDAAGIKNVILDFRSALPDLRVEILRQIAEDDLVVTHKRFHATFTKELMGIPPTGKPITISTIDIIRLRNGKYLEHWAVRDMSSLRASQ